MSRNFAAIAAIAVIGLGAFDAAFAQSCTTVTAVPTTITSPGRYCLTQNLLYLGSAPIGTAESAILIASDDVTVDLSGYTLQGDSNAAANPNSAGVRAEDRRNVKVINGSIRNLGLGVTLFDLSGGITPTGYAVEHVVIDGVQSYGILVGGNLPVIRNNRVSNLSYARTLVTAAGISVSGVGANVSDNAIANINATAMAATGIYVNSTASVVQSNSIVNVTSSRVAYGVLLGSASTGTHVRNNVIQGATSTVNSAITVTNGTANLLIDNNTIAGFYYAINLSGSPASKYRNNTATGAGSASPYYSGVNIGGNN